MYQDARPFLPSFLDEPKRGFHVLSNVVRFVVFYAQPQATVPISVILLRRKDFMGGRVEDVCNLI